MFFSFLAVFPLPESYQNDPKFHFNTLLRSDTQKSSKNVENTTVFWSRCETVFWPPPPAKADIATAILTNVIEHLVLLFCPPISTPSPPKRCGRIYIANSLTIVISPTNPNVHTSFYVRQLRPGRGANRLPWWQGDRLWLRSCTAIATAIQGVTGTQRCAVFLGSFMH